MHNYISRLQYFLDFKTRLTWRKFQLLRSNFYAQLWQQAAVNIGAAFIPWEDGYHRISRNGLTTFVRLSNVMLDDYLLLELMGNKTLTYKLLSEKGKRIPAYLHYNSSTYHLAQEFLRDHGGSVVVKPARGTGGGRGITTDIRDDLALKKATTLAARYSGDLILEEHIQGDSYRLLYLDGEYIDAIRRDPPRLTGDGKQNINQLVKAENQRRLETVPYQSMSPLFIDRDCRLVLKKKGMTPETVLDNGQEIILKNTVNENSSFENHNIKHLIHPETIKMGSQLVKEVGVCFAGLDLISSDISIPLSESKGVINEINTTPGIHHHYLISNPDQGVAVAELVLNYMFNHEKGVMVL